MDELERFKTELHLAEVVAGYGYTLDKRESSRASLVMRRASDGDKIVVATAPDGHGVYFSVRDTGDNGSVIDFVMRRDGVSLGGARKVLRSWLAVPSSFPTARRPFPIPKPAPMPRDQVALIAQWYRLIPYRGGYLEGRGIMPNTVTAFADHVRIDARGNVAFRHNDRSGVTGWELKNKGFTGFSSGGRKALFACRIGTTHPAPHPRIVIAESAIDVMSFYQFNSAPGLFVSFAGALSPDQRTLLADVLTRYLDAEILAATDTDPDGEGFAAMIQSLRPDARRARSPEGKDWNDALRLALT
ncbi:DUF3991 and TOPRIM domain-containing protein [Candidatus Magnetaquicoccus inordinatus]|uniref:DUF3991 and TOPRIM domain-containing protein n=1 Tax=Candidatus Magnetaquicoccus inordinatus TaxID=2496818 RepID=UPI00102CC44C|nr:DUF3991 and TOPRIM domain-containing protein [Candidatus Magnetaquicoccus inordinatus]